MFTGGAQAAACVKALSALLVRFLQHLSVRVVRDTLRPLAGFAVGDGWTGCVPQDGKQTNYCVDLDNVGLFNYPNVAQGPWYDLEFFHGHSQMSEALHTKMLATCTADELDEYRPK